MTHKKLWLTFLFILSGAMLQAGQVITGGNFVIEQSSEVPGGDATGDMFLTTGTAGQPAAGNALRGSSYGITSGFWNYVLDQSSSTPVELGGQVRVSNGPGIRNVVVTLTEQNGSTRTTVTSGFGYYRFNGLVPGQTVTIRVQAKHYNFANPVQTVNVSIDAEDLDFVGDPF